MTFAAFIATVVKEQTNSIFFFVQKKLFQHDSDLFPIAAAPSHFAERGKVLTNSM